MAIRADAYWERVEATQGAVELFQQTCVRVGFELKLSRAMIQRLKLLGERERSWRAKNVKRNTPVATLLAADSDFIVGNRALVQRGLISPQPGRPSHGKNWWRDDVLNKPTYRLTRMGWLALELINLAGL